MAQSRRMNQFLAVFLSVTVLALLIWEARSGHTLHESPLIESHAAPLFHEYQCDGGSGHVACQILPATLVASPLQVFAFAQSQFEIEPVRASSRISSPQPPPPRSAS